MNPIEFKEQNVTYAEDRAEYLPLPAFKSDGPQGQVVSCWKLSFKEKVRIIFTGKIWCSLMMFEKKELTPSIITTKKSDVL